MLHRAYQARQKRGFLGPRIQWNGFARCAVEPFRQCLNPAITTGQPGNPVLLGQGLAGETACPTSIRSTLRAPFPSRNVETPGADLRSANFLYSGRGYVNSGVSPFPELAFC